MADVAKLNLNGTSYDIKDANVRAKIPLYVQDFGAVGNGSTNDSSAIQNAINAAQASNRPLEFEAGKNYLIGTPLEITYSNNKTHLVINGNDASIFTSAGIDAFRIHMTGDWGGTSGNNAYNWFTYVTINNLDIRANSRFHGVAFSFGTGTKPALDGKIILNNVRVSGFEYGYDYYNARSIYAYSCSLDVKYLYRFNFYKRNSEDTGVLFNGDSFFQFCVFKLNEGTAVTKRVGTDVTAMRSISGMHFSHCDFYGTAPSGAYFDFNTASEATMAAAFDWFFDNCQWDGISCPLFQFTAYGTEQKGLVQDFVVSNCYAYYVTQILNCSGAAVITINNSFFRLGIGSTPSQVMSLYPIAIKQVTLNNATKRSKHITISNNIIEGMSTEPTYLAGCDDVTITGNVIMNKAWTAFQLANTNRIAITGNVIADDASLTNPRIYYLGADNTGYNISGNVNNSTAIAQ